MIDMEAARGTSHSLLGYQVFFLTLLGCIPAGVAGWALTKFLDSNRLTIKLATLGIIAMCFPITATLWGWAAYHDPWGFWR